MAGKPEAWRHGESIISVRLGDDDDTANREYIRHFLLRREEETGRKYGLEPAEPFHYIGPEASDPIEAFVRQNAIPL